MGDCNRLDGSCPIERQPKPTSDKPVNWCQGAACEAWSKGTTTMYDGQTPEKYKESLAQFKFNADNAADAPGGANEAYKKALETGKPIVFVIGKFDGNNTKDITSQIQKNGQKDAIYMYIDPTTCVDKNLKEFAEKELADGWNASKTVVCSVKQEKGKPVELTNEYELHGGHYSMMPELADKIAKAKREPVPQGPSEAELKEIADKEAAAKKAAEDEKEMKECEKAAADHDKAVKEEEKAAEKIAKDLKDAEERGRLKGVAEGKVAGKVEGLAQGKAEGLAQGKVEGKVELTTDAAKLAALALIPGALPAVAGAKLAKEVMKDPATAAEVAAAITIPGALPVIAGVKLAKEVVKDPVTAVEVGAALTIPGALPVIAGVELGKAVVQNPKVAEAVVVVAAPAVALGQAIVENPGTTAKVAAAVAFPPLVPAYYGAKLGVKVAEKGIDLAGQVYDSLPEAPSLDSFIPRNPFK